MNTKLSVALILLSLLVFMGGCMFQSPSINGSSGESPNLTNGGPRFTAISSLGGTGLALRSDGTVMCWGLNFDGSCDSTHNLTQVKSISSPNFIIKNDGTVTAWGDPNLNRLVPSNLTHIVSITRSQFCNIALKDDGTVVAWRAFVPSDYTTTMSDAQLARITNQTDLTSISGNLGLKKDGTVVTWYVNYQNVSEDSQSYTVPNLSNIIAISNLVDHYAALRNDGTVVAWKIPDMGEENAGQLIPIHIVQNLTDIRAISVGIDHSLALKRDGTVVRWTDDSLQSTGLSDIAAISLGTEFDLALKNNGSIVAWGEKNEYGQLFTPGKLSNVKSISSGSNNIVLKKDGAIVTWGYEFTGLCCVYGHEPEGITNVTGVLAGVYQNFILENNNTIYGWGEEEIGPYPVKRIPHPYLTLFSGHNVLYAVEKNGNLVVLSFNATNFNISQRLDDVIDVTSWMGLNTVAVKKDGTVTAWGGSNLNREDNVPGNLTGVMGVSAGVNHNLALKNDGTVVGWGVNVFGQTDVPKGLSNVTAVAAGGFQRIEKKKDGMVVCWGGNISGECIVPENLHDVVAISAGFGQSLALKKDGTVVAWGKTVIPDWNG